jgi:hypothetical protein
MAKKRINSRNKGRAGEHEFCKWLRDLLNLDIVPERNLDQVRATGADVINIHPFVFEVKRCEKLELRKWWVKLINNVESGEIPVLAYRQNHQQWRLAIDAVCVGLSGCFVVLEPHESIYWLKKTWHEINN